jgi:PPOX class probable F420-dependent enzyme
MEIAGALEFVRSRQHAVLATQRADGRPQLSNITYGVDDSGRILISVTDGRAKTVNLRRDQRATLHVTQPDFWAYVVLDCDAELAPPAEHAHDATVDALVEYYRLVIGEHPDWDDYRRAMVADRRLLLTLTPTHAYGVLP